MTDPRRVPREIGPTADERRLRIAWEDGVTHEYEPRALRLLCPCAGCVDETSGVRRITEEMVPEGIYPTAIHYVGRYALQFVWSDGHDTGFYTFVYLRGIGDGG